MAYCSQAPPQFKNSNSRVLVMMATCTTSGLEQLAEEKVQELLLIRQQQAQAVQETLKGQLLNYRYIKIK